MNPENTPNKHTDHDCVDAIEGLVNQAYDKAKWWAGSVIGLQAALFVAGIAAIVFTEFTLSYPWIALPLALLGTVMAGRAAKFKGMAERAKRQHEYLAGFGVAPFPRDARRFARQSWPGTSSGPGPSAA